MPGCSNSEDIALTSLSAKIPKHPKFVQQGIK